MIRRFLAFLGGAFLGYFLTVVGAFVFWSMIGSSGPDYTPLLVVLFGIAPVVALLLGLVAAGVLRRGDARSMKSERPMVTSTLPPRRNSPMQIAIAVIVALLVGAVLWATGETPHGPLILWR
jgi:hypothetical protein